MISFKEVKEKIEKMGYYATDELLYDTYNALALFCSSNVNPGQDIFAICLEGPPGAGKTEFAKTYTKLANELFNNVELVDYQCDATTGKTELFEDINISAAIRGDADNVNIPGKLIEAIKKVNSGKKVVLFIDEYDKAREETDAFLLQFLQSGKINSTQHGDLEVKDEFKGNLQVILCKNDMREELSGPLSRRIRIVRLDYMKPSLFYKVARRLLIDERKNPVNDGLLNLVSLMYEKAYSNKEMYNRLPSCSEMLIAIEDADRLIRLANAPQNIVYNIIIRNMFKSPDDITTFESSLNSKNSKDNTNLSTLIQTMKENTEESENEVDFNYLIAENVFGQERECLEQKVIEMEALITEYKFKFAKMEQERQQTIMNEAEKIRVGNGQFVSRTDNLRAVRNFTDESANIKRGYNIFDLSDDNWTEIATITWPHLSHDYVIRKLVENAGAFGIAIYENGILLQARGEQKLIAIFEYDSNNNPTFKILCRNLVVPSKYFYDIVYFLQVIKQIYDSQPQRDNLSLNYTFNIDGLVYNETEMPYDLVDDDVYHVIYNVDENGVIDILSNLKCDDPDHAQEISKKIMNSQKRVRKNE